MAEKEKKEPGSETASASEAPPKKKSPIMMIAIVAIVMIVEAVGIFAVVGITGGGKNASAEGLEHKGSDDSEDAVELPLVSDRFQNMQTGKTWIWNVEIVLRVKKKNETAVTGAVQAKSAEILEGVSMIFSRAQLSQLKEPGRQTINRQITAYLNKLIGPDAEDQPRVDRILFPKFVGYESD